MAKDPKQAAAECLAYNQTLDKVFVSSDGECFPHKNDAINHARNLQDKEIMKFERDGEEQDLDTTVEKKHSLNVADTIKLILEAADEEQLDMLIEGEDRKTVIVASEKQRAILKQKALNDQAAQADEALKARREELPKDEPGTKALGDGVVVETAKSEDQTGTAQKAEAAKSTVVKEESAAKPRSPRKSNAASKQKEV